MRPHHITLQLQFPNPRVLVPAVAVPALHQLAALGGKGLRRQPPVCRSRLPLHELLCQASSGWRCSETAQEASKASALQGRPCSSRQYLRCRWAIRLLTCCNPAACARPVGQQAITVGLSILMILSPLLCAFNPAAAQQISVSQSAALLSRP